MFHPLAVAAGALADQRTAGFVTGRPTALLQTTALDIAKGVIAAVYVMRNPDKLRRLDAALH